MIAIVKKTTGNKMQKKFVIFSILFIVLACGAFNKKPDSKNQPKTPREETQRKPSQDRRLQNISDYLSNISLEDFINIPVVTIDRKSSSGKVFKIKKKKS